MGYSDFFRVETDPLGTSFAAALVAPDKVKVNPGKEPYLTVNGEEYEVDPDVSPVSAFLSDGYYIRFRKKVPEALKFVKPGVMVTLQDYPNPVRLLEPIPASETLMPNKWRCWDYSDNRIVKLYVTNNNVQKVKDDGRTVFSR
jgi:hypothetical protein